MIRPTTPQDASAILSLAASLELFEPQQLEQLGLMFTTSTERTANPQPFWLVDDASELGEVGLSGVSYCEPDRMTDGSWTLQLIGIRPARQQQGLGKALIKAVEKSLRQRQARILTVETAASMKSNLVFYMRCGFELEGTIRDFYADGEDKVIFRKALNSQ